MVATVHAFEDVFGDVKRVTERVHYSDSVCSDLRDLEVCSLREELVCLKLLYVPERRTGALCLCSPAFLPFADNLTQDERSCCNEGFGHLFLSLCSTCVGKVCDIHGISCWVVVFLHDFNHLVTTLVNFYKCEDDAARREFSHLILDLETIW